MQKCNVMGSGLTINVILAPLYAESRIATDTNIFFYGYN